MSIDQQTSQNKCQQLLDRLLKGYSSERGLCSSSSSIYDTAWVALVSKNVDGSRKCAFPSSLRYICDSQQDDGGWPEYDNPVDRILNTLAALLVLVRHNVEIDELYSNSMDKIENAKRFLEERLVIWDVQDTDYVGFELIIPKMLELLEAEGIVFRFPGRELLNILRRTKMTKFSPNIVYSQKTTVQHSLEAFIDVLDFSKIRREVGRSLEGSPSSTAAYLMSSSSRDPEAENYLSSILSDKSGREPGSVPSAYPTTVFEIAWVSTRNTYRTVIRKL
jgi:hypothetical protein